MYMYMIMNSSQGLVQTRRRKFGPGQVLPRGAAIANAKLPIAYLYGSIGA